MIIKKYAEYIPTVAEVYHQISPMDALWAIRDIAERYGLSNLYGVTMLEIDKRNNKPSTGAPSDVSLYRILQKDAVALEALRDLYACAIEYRLPLFALTVQDSMLYYEEQGKSLAKRLFQSEYEKSPAIIDSNFGMTLVVNLYREPSDDLSTIQTKTIQRFYMGQQKP
jgi:hypothetical protein